MKELEEVGEGVQEVETWNGRQDRDRGGHVKAFKGELYTKGSLFGFSTQLPPGGSW